MMDIRCPESCTYLEQGRNTEANKAAQLTLAHIGPDSMRRVYGDQRCLAVITFLEKTIAEAQRHEYSDLVDAEVIDALSNTLKNLETAESGLIYEHQETSPRVQALSRAIREGLEKAFQDLEDSFGDIAREFRPSSTEIMEIIKFERSFVERLGNGQSDDRTYVRYVSLMTPWPAEETESRIIL